MAVQLSKKDLENISAFRYQASGSTPLEDWFFIPFWNFLANYCLPDWLAPNALTLAGLIVPLISFVVTATHNPSFDQVQEPWVYALCFFAYFWYQTIDAIDGKQARRTDNCSPLGQLLDHNLDQISFTIFMCNAMSMLLVGPNMIYLLMSVPGVMAAHYSIEYRTHFTKFHATVVGFIGATEQLVIQEVLTIYIMCLAFTGDSIDKVGVTIPFINYETNFRDIVMFGIMASGFHWTTENYVRGYWASKEKGYAAACLIPYIEFIAMFYCSKYSRFFKQCPMAFIAMNGLFLTYVTGYFNLNSTASMKFDYLYFWPFFYAGALYIDSIGLLDDQKCKIMYGLYSAWLLKSYLSFMWSVVSQLTAHSNTSFLRVKDHSKRLFGGKAKKI